MPFVNKRVRIAMGGGGLAGAVDVARTGKGHDDGEGEADEGRLPPPIRWWCVGKEGWFG